MENIIFDVEKNKPIITKSSKGDQPKWLYEGKWYKMDSLGYEGLSEIIISRLLLSIDASNILEYSPVNIIYNGEERSGCYSNNFLKENEELITLERLHLSYQGLGLSEKIESLKTTEDRIKYTVDFVENITGLNTFHKWLTSIIEIDSMFLNEDRHTNNLAVIRNYRTKEYSLSPIFDNGLSILSDLKAYPINVKWDIHMRNVKAKPFSTDFHKQLSACHKLYGNCLNLEFSERDINEALIGLEKYYSEEIIQRTTEFLRKRLGLVDNL